MTDLAPGRINSVAVVMHVRPALITDARAIAEVHVTSWQQAYRGLVPGTVLSGLSIPEREANWSKAISEGTSSLLVAEVDGKVVGFLAFGPSRDPDATADTQEIMTLYVAPHSWSRGVGRALWLASRSALLAQGTKVVNLWVLAENGRALRFYKAAGFDEQPGRVRIVERGGTPLEQVRCVQILAG